MPFDTLNPFSAVHEYRAVATGAIGFAFRETNLPIPIPFFDGNKVVYKVISGISQDETEYLFAAVGDEAFLGFNPYVTEMFENDKFLTYSYTKTLIDQFQACSKHNNELWWDVHLKSRLALLAARNKALLKPVLVIPKNEVLQSAPSFSICLYGVQPTIPTYQYATPLPYAYTSSNKTPVMRDCPLNFATDYESMYDLVDLTTWGAIAVNLDHGYSFIYTFESKVYVFNLFQALENITTDVTGGTAVVLSAEQVATLEEGGNVTLPMAFNFVFYGETVEFTCSVALSKLVAEVQYATLTGVTSNGLAFNGVNSFVTNYVYYTNEDKTYGSSTLTFTIMAVLTSNHCVITFSDAITEQNFSSYHILNNINARYSSASLTTFMKKAMMQWNPTIFGSDPQADDVDPDLLYVSANGYGVPGLRSYVCRNTISASENSSEFYLDYFIVNNNPLYFNKFIISYSSEYYHYYSYNQYPNLGWSSTRNQDWVQEIITGVGRDMSISLISGYERYNAISEGEASTTNDNCNVNLLKSMRMTCDENGNLSVIDTTGVDIGSLGSYNFSVWFGYTPATVTYVPVGSAPFVAMDGLTNTEFGYGTGYQYSEQCDVNIQVYTSTMGDFSFIYAPIQSVTPTATFGLSNLGFSLTKHDDRHSTYIDNSTYYAVIEALQYGDRVKITYQNEWFNRSNFYPMSAPFSSYFATNGVNIFNQGRLILQNAYFGNSIYLNFTSPTTGYIMHTVVTGHSYTVNGNINSMVNCDTQALQETIDAIYAPRPNQNIYSPPPSLDVLPVVDLNTYDGGIYSLYSTYENVIDQCTYTRSVTYQLYYDASGANLLLNNYQEHYRPHYFSTKSLSSKKLIGGNEHYGFRLASTSSGDVFIKAFNNLQMLNHWYYSLLLETNYYNVVVAYRVKNNDIVGIAIGAYKKLRSKGNQLYLLCSATTQEAWNAKITEILDDWLPVHSYNMPNNFMEIMPIICLQSSIVHIFEDFDTRYLQNL